MEDEKQGKWGVKIDELLQYPPEDVFAMFVNDLRNTIGSVHAASDLLSEEMSEEETNEIIGIIQRSARNASDGLDFALKYLKARQDMNNAADKGSKV